MSLPNPIDYFRACRAAMTVGGDSFISSVISVLRARLSCGIGPRYHSLYQLNTRPADRWPEYLIDEDVKVILRRVNSAEAHRLCKDKWAFFAHCHERGLATVPILARIDTQIAEGDRLANDADRWVELLAQAPERIFIKQLDGSWGQGAFSAKRQPDGSWAFAGRTGDLRAMHRHCMDNLDAQRGWIVQPMMRNHPSLLRIMSGKALGTLRVITWRGQSGTEACYIMIRLPVGDSTTDNFVHGTTGNLTVPIDAATGILGIAKGSSDRRWPVMCAVEKHPDTGETIAGVQIPYWQEMLSLFKRAQDSIPGLYAAGWDIAITETGPVLVEGNSTFDVDLPQASFERGIRSEFLRDKLLTMDPGSALSTPGLVVR